MGLSDHDPAATMTVPVPQHSGSGHPPLTELSPRSTTGDRQFASAARVPGAGAPFTQSYETGSASGRAGGEAAKS